MKSSLWTSQNRSQHASGDTMGSHGSGADLAAAAADGGRIPLAEMHNSGGGGTFGYSRGVRRFKKTSTPASAPVIHGNSSLSTATGFGRLFASANTGGGNRGMASSRKISDPVFSMSAAGKLASKSKAAGVGGGGAKVRSGLTVDTFMPRYNTSS